MLIIGEKLNGAIKSVARAIKNKDEVFIKILTSSQLNCRADYLDICSGKADGDFGKKTEKAVRKAQEAFGMEQTGIADDAFQRRLFGE